jgi:HEAT repeat protein
LIDQEEIHNQSLSDDWNEREEALDKLRDNFSSLPDKQQAWNDLIRLTNDENKYVRSKAASALGSAFSQVPDKQQAWNDLIRLTNDENKYVRSKAASALGSAFSQMPDKQQAWNDLLRLTNDEIRLVRSGAASALGSAFSQMPDKQQAWNDLHRLTNDENRNVRSDAAYALGSAFSQVPDKQQAWNDLHRLTNDEDSSVRSSAAYALRSAFSHVPDKQQAWNDLIRLTNDKNEYVRSNAASALGSAFSQIPGKQQAWNDLLRLTNDKESSVRYMAGCTLGSAFSQMPDKQQAWNDLHRLTNDEIRKVRNGAAYALGSAFSQVPDKQQAWNDLHRLTNDEDSSVRSSAAYALRSAFSHVPDKQQAWNDLHRLISEYKIHVRCIATFSLGSAFSQVPDKQQAWNDLHRLTNDEDSSVRASSNHSLGRVSIFMASHAETEEDYKKYLETAIEFFEKVALESSFKNSYNPAQFCLPFYRSFHTIIFKMQEAKEEVNKYLEEAKVAIEGSKSKELLFEAVENLAKALEEVQKLGDIDLQAMKGELNFYRIYCDRVSELMNDTHEKAPYATNVLIKGLPILDRNLKATIEEIQEKAKIACKESKGTEAKEIVCGIYNEIQSVIVDYQLQYIETTKVLEDILSIVKMKIPQIPENKFILSKIEAVDNKVISADKYRDLPLIISLMPTIKVVPEQELGHQLHEFKVDMKGEIAGAKEEIIGEIVSAKEEIINEIVNIKDKLGCISFNVSNIGLNSYNIILNLDMIRVEMEKLKRIYNSNTSSLEVSDSKLTEQLNALNNILQDRWNELEYFTVGLAKDDDTKKILSIVNKLKQSKLSDLIQTPASIATLIGFLIQAIQVCQQCKLL